MAPDQLDQVEDVRDRQSLGATHSTSRQKLRRGRLPLAIAGLAIVCLLGVFFISYGSKLYENWRERRSLQKANTFLQEGKLSDAAQTAQELVRQHPDSLAALSILADTTERHNPRERDAARARI